METLKGRLHESRHRAASPVPLLRQVTLEGELQESIATSSTAIRHPWEHITVFDLVRLFQSESWAGSLTLADFNRVLDKLDLDSEALGRRLFDAFDQDGNGRLDFRELFLGMSMLLSGSYEERLKCAFMMMDSNGTGRVSKDELARLLRYISPRSVSTSVVDELANNIMREVAPARAGLMTYREFLRWPGKDEVLNWIGTFQNAVLVKAGAFSTQSQRSRSPTASRGNHGMMPLDQVARASTPGRSPLREQAMATMAQLEELEENISSTRNKWKRNQIQLLAGPH